MCSILENIDHPFIVSLRFAFQTKHKLYMVFGECAIAFTTSRFGLGLLHVFADYFNGGELYHYLAEGGKFDEDRARFHAAEIICGLDYLHRRGIVYRDLKVWSCYGGLASDAVRFSLILRAALPAGKHHLGFDWAHQNCGLWVGSVLRARVGVCARVTAVASCSLSKEGVHGESITSICGTPECVCSLTPVPTVATHQVSVGYSSHAGISRQRSCVSAPMVSALTGGAWGRCCTKCLLGCRRSMTPTERRCTGRSWMRP